MIWIALALGSARAFAPSGAVYEGIEPHRPQVAHAGEQLRRLRSPAWQRFTAGEGLGWHARFDETTGTPRVVWGPGIAAPTDRDALVDFVESFVDRHGDLFGTEAGSLELRSASYVPRTATWYVDFDELRDGVPTWRGGISARVVQGRLALLHVATAPGAVLTGAWSIGAPAAIDSAIRHGPASAASHTDPVARQVLLEEKRIDGLFLRRVYEVRTRTAKPPGIWVSFVDAESGVLLHVYNEVRFATGTVTAQHHERTPDGSPLIVSPLSLAYVEGTFDGTFTAADGTYTVSDSLQYRTTLDGEYLTVFNADGAEGLLSGVTPDLQWTTTDATQAEIDTYVFAHHVRDWGLLVAPEVGMSTVPLDAEVNVDSACNAYYDGALHFFDAGFGCNNTGEIADVVYHEWGHGFHVYSLEAGIFDSSLSEGAADTVAFLQTNDHRIAPYFGVDGSVIRDVEPDHVYPEDYIQFYGYSHYNGLIFGGAMWDLLELLQAEEGDEQGSLTTGSILAGILKGGTDIPGTFYEALVADDDDADLGNGTPHACEIYDAFGRHGLGVASGGGLVLTQHEPITEAPADVPIPVTADLVPVAEGCVDATFVSGTLWFQVNGGEWEAEQLFGDGTSVDGEIPAQPVGTIVSYYIDGATGSGERFASPWGGIVTPFTFMVGDTIEIHCDDFEEDDGGYTHDLVDGEEEEGADDWQWGVPNGSSGDPAAAWSGDFVWGNDLGFEGYNGDYQPEKVNRLRSPKLDTLHYTDVYVEYRRWLQVEDGTYDQAVLTAGGDPVWTNWVGATGQDHHLDTTWMSHVVDLPGDADQDDVRLGWEIHSDGGLQFGGWTIDDVCLKAPATPDNRLAITDFVATVVGATAVTFTWTQPSWLPLERVVVTRRGDRFPEAWDDGDVVVDITAPSAGAAARTSDQRAYAAGDTFYAVYGHDGESWLSWTVEGWNAAAVDVNGGPAPGDADGDGIPDAEDPDFKDGCGCNGASGAPSFLTAMLLALIQRRRSRY